MSKYCIACRHYRLTKDGPYCQKGRSKAVSPITTCDSWEDAAGTETVAVATKVCKKCGRELPVQAFGRHHLAKDGYQPICRECRSEAQKGKPQAGKKVRKRSHPSYVDEATGVTMKWCNKCGQYKPIDEFGINKRYKDGHTYECKACHNAITAEQHRRRMAALREAAAKAERTEEPETAVATLTEAVTDIPATTTLADYDLLMLLEELRRRGFHGSITMDI